MKLKITKLSVLDGLKTYVLIVAVFTPFAYMGSILEGELEQTLILMNQECEIAVLKGELPTDYNCASLEGITDFGLFDSYALMSQLLLLALITMMAYFILNFLHAKEKKKLRGVQ